MNNSLGKRVFIDARATNNTKVDLFTCNCKCTYSLFGFVLN